MGGTDAGGWVGRGGTAGIGPIAFELLAAEPGAPGNGLDPDGEDSSGG